jgi:hypothetical protein
VKNVNSNSDNVVASNLNNVTFFFWKIVKIELKNKHHKFYFLIDAMIGPPKKFPIFFTLLINIEWTKASIVHMDLFYKKKQKNKIESFFGVLVATQTIIKEIHKTA